MEYLFIFLLLLSSLLSFSPTATGQTINGAVDLTIQLLQYENPNGYTFTGASCSVFGTASQTCNLGLKICMEPVKGDSSAPNICSGQWYTTGQVTNSKNSVNFNPGKTYGTWRNPHKFYLPNGWQPSYLKVVTVDYDSNGNEYLIDNFLFHLDSSAVNLGNSPQSIINFKGVRTKTTPTLLSFKLSVSCPFGTISTLDCGGAPLTLPPPTKGPTTPGPAPTPISGSLALTMNLRFFSNPSDLLANNMNCDVSLTAPPTCDLQFKICLDPPGAITPEDYSKCSTSWINTGQVTTNADSITFIDQYYYGSWYNPHTFPLYTGFTKVYLKVVVYDANTGASHLIDNYFLVLTTTMFGSKLGSLSFQNITGQNLARRQPTYLSMDMTLSCLAGKAKDGVSCKSVPAPPTSPASVPITPTTPKNVVKGESSIFVVGTLKESTENQMAENIANIVTTYYNEHPPTSNRDGDGKYVHFPLSVTVQYDARYQDIASHDAVTKVSFTVIESLTGDHLSKTYINKAFASYSQRALQDQLGTNIGTVTLISGTSVELDSNPWWKAHWYVFLILGLLIAFLLLALLTIIIAYQRRDGRRKGMDDQIIAEDAVRHNWAPPPFDPVKEDTISIISRSQSRRRLDEVGESVHDIDDSRPPRW